MQATPHFQGHTWATLPFARDPGILLVTATALAVTTGPGATPVADPVAPAPLQTDALATLEHCHCTHLQTVAAPFSRPSLESQPGLASSTGDAVVHPGSSAASPQPLHSSLAVSPALFSMQHSPASTAPGSTSPDPEAAGGRSADQDAAGPVPSSTGVAEATRPFHADVPPATEARAPCSGHLATAAVDHGAPADAVATSTQGSAGELSVSSLVGLPDRHTGGAPLIPDRNAAAALQPAAETGGQGSQNPSPVRSGVAARPRIVMPVRPGSVGHGSTPEERLVAAQAFGSAVLPEASSDAARAAAPGPPAAAEADAVLASSALPPAVSAEAAEQDAGNTGADEQGEEVSRTGSLLGLFMSMVGGRATDAPEEVPGADSVSAAAPLINSDPPAEPQPRGSIPAGIAVQDLSLIHI